MKELISVWNEKHLARVMLYCFRAWLHLITLDTECFFVIILSSKNELHIFFIIIMHSFWNG